MTDAVTLDDVEKFLQEATGYKADGLQMAAARILLETMAAQLAAAYDGAPKDLIDAHLSLTRQHLTLLVDSGGRVLDAGSPLVTVADLEALWKKTAGPKAAAVTPDLTPVVERVDRLERRVQATLEKMQKQQPAAPDLMPVLERAEQLERRLLAGLASVEGLVRVSSSAPPDLGPVNARLAAIAAAVDALSRRPGADLAPVQAQLNALAKTVIAAAGSHDGEITAMAGDLTELCEDVTALRLKVDTMVLPVAYIPLEPVGAEMIPSGGPLTPGEWAEFDDVVQRKDDIRAAALQAISEVREQHEARTSRVVAPRPGCFFNDDGTITCKTCGIAKQPEEFYGDKQAQTGRKSACKLCEKAVKKPKARRAAA
jgi:hypothetical protein